MATYTNFYETIEEALMRLKSTVVLYDGMPYYVWTITDHRNDGIFRVYMSPLGETGNMPPPPPFNQFPHGSTNLGPAMDTWMEQNPKCNVLRKQMNSPLFNKFRPFPLGMANYGHFAYYLERVPARPRTEQGLVSNMIMSTTCILNDSKKTKGNCPVPIYSLEFTDAILGKYPTPKQCLEGMTGDFENESVAFHREFSLIRGPLDVLFVQYRQDLVGVLPRGDFSQLHLGKKFKHIREAVEDLKLFYNID